MSYHGQHERRDVPVQVPVYVTVFMAVFVPLGALAMWLLVSTVWDVPPQPPPLFPDDAAPRIRAEPPLQPFPPADMARLSTRQHERLRSVGWIDRQNRIVHMPIHRAMELLAQRGLPKPASNWQPRPAAPAPPSSSPPSSSAPQQGGGGS